MQTTGYVSFMAMRSQVVTAFECKGRLHGSVGLLARVQGELKLGY
jgi:hypothetical protein